MHLCRRISPHRRRRRASPPSGAPRPGAQGARMWSISAPAIDQDNSARDACSALLVCQLCCKGCLLLRAHAHTTVLQAEAAAVATKRPLRVMISGAPAAGKGTQCERIVKKVRRCAAVTSKLAHLPSLTSSCVVCASPTSPPPPLSHTSHPFLPHAALYFSVCSTTSSISLLVICCVSRWPWAHLQVCAYKAAIIFAAVSLH